MLKVVSFAFKSCFVVLLDRFNAWKCYPLLQVLLFCFILYSNSKSSTFKLLNSEDSQTTISFQNGDDDSGNTYDIISNNDNLKFSHNNESILVELNSIENININTPLYINSSSIDILLNSKDSSFRYNNIEQFILYSIDTFQEEDIKWSNAVLSTCGNNDKYILGGYCHYSNNITERKYYIEAKHNYIRIKATFNFYDNWEGEGVFMKFNNEIIWYETHKWCDKILVRNCKKYGINVCGGEYPDKIGVPIDIIIPYEEKEFTIQFGSSIQKDPCEASWGISDVSIYIK